MASSSRNKIVVRRDRQVVPLSAINPTQDNVSITVRVLRTWEALGALEMVLVDNEGTKIAGRVGQSHIYLFGKMLREGAVVVISNFELLAANGEFRPTAHDYRLILKFHSVVLPVPETEVPVPPFNFTPPEYCFEKEFNKNFLVDVFGIYVRIGNDTKFQSKGKTCTRMTLELQNEG